MTTTAHICTASGQTRLHLPAQNRPKCALNWDNRGTSEKRPRRVLEHPRGMADLLGVDVVKPTASLSAGSACCRCGRSKADEPDQFRLIFRRGAVKPRMASLCRPCEREADAKYREKRKNDTRTCTVNGCKKKVRAADKCSHHYNRSLETDPCTFTGCNRLARPDSLCAGHKRQQAQGKTLTPLQEKSDPAARDHLGRKRCSSCKTWQSVENFYRNSRYADGLTIRCVRCHRNATIRRQYGITLTDYQRLLDAQGGGCAVCGKTEQAEGRMLAIDHDHACCPGQKSCGQCVRGLLCARCNLHLGAVGDSIGHLEAMVTYLRAASSSRTGNSR